MFTFGNNGNILTQQRYEGSTLVDNLSYQYATNSAGDLLSNRLYSVDDAVTVASLSATDMEDMPAYINASPNASNNYTYTQIGELKSDNQEEISEIHWRVDSKISEITRTSGSVKKNLKFEYDAMGNRVAKHVYAGSLLESSTYYVRDAQGNVMGVYEHKMDAENAVMEYKLIERNIYGSAQVGICKDTVDLNITNAAGALTQATYYHARQLNHRQYSLSNHLGNVLTTIGDGKAAADSNNDGVIDYYVAYIISVSDYSPFGVELANRSWSLEEYRNGFGGHLKDDEIKGEGNWYTFGDYGYDPRIVQRPSLDPKANKYPEISPYSVFRGNPIYYVDKDGKEPRWGQLGNLNQILGEMWKAFNAHNVVTATVGAKLEAMSNYFAADRKFTRNEQGQLVDVDASKNIDRYMYTEKAGWIDMHHFFRLANYTSENGQTMAELYAYNSERYQEWTGSPSGWSYEDIASDIAGIEFWLQYGDRLTNAEITLTDATKEFFTNLGAVEPSQAPNYEYIPHMINPDYELKSSNKRGLKGDDLKERHKKIFEKRTKVDQEKIKEAHKTIRN